MPPITMPQQKPICIELHFSPENISEEADTNPNKMQWKD